MSFDVEGARRAGYGDAEIVDFLAQSRNFDAAGARRAGYSDADLLGHLTAPPAPATTPATPANAPGVGERFAMGLGDVARGAEQIGARTMQGDGGMIGRMLRRNPNIAATMDAGEAALPRPTPEAVDASIRARETEYQTRRGPDAGIDLARIGGNVAATLPAAMALPAGTGVVGTAIAGAGQGAALSAVQPVTSGDFADEKKQQMEMGGIIGAVTGPLGYVVGRALSPRLSPEVRTLADEGVQMTPGQMIGGMARRVEDAVSSVPGVGESVRQAQRASVDSLNIAVANRALRAIGQTVPDGMQPGGELTAHVGRTIGQFYDDALSAARPFTLDGQFVRDLSAVSNRFMTADSRTEFLDTIRQNVMARIRGGQIDPAVYQEVRSELGAAARDAAGPTASRADRELSRAFYAMQEAFDDLFKRANPTQAPAIDAANTAWAVLTRMETAGASRGARDGVFTPGMLDTAVRQGDRTVRRRDYARGDALLQDMSGPASSVLPRQVADSGTPERLATMGLLTGAGASAALGLSPLQMLALGGAYAAYTSPAQRAIQAAITAQRPLPARLAGDAIARSGGAVTVPLGALMLSPPAPSLPQ